MRAAVSSDTTPWNWRMSSWVPSGVAVWPPMLYRPPPIDTGPGVAFTAVTMSSTVRGVTTRAIVTGCSRVTSSIRTLESGIAPTATAGVRTNESALTMTPNRINPHTTSRSRFPSRPARRSIVGRGTGFGRLALERRCFLLEPINAI